MFKYNHCCLYSYIIWICSLRHKLKIKLVKILNFWGCFLIFKPSYNLYLRTLNKEPILPSLDYPTKTNHNKSRPTSSNTSTNINILTMSVLLSTPTPISYFIHGFISFLKSFWVLLPSLYYFLFQVNICRYTLLLMFSFSQNRVIWFGSGAQ